MRKSEVISHYGTQQNVANALGISQRAVSGWREVVPLQRAMKLQQLTDGQLQVDTALYPDAFSEPQ
jgi:predicted transcriptional regulator